jgi:hypothetical protein
MRRLELDFLRAPSCSPRAGLLLLAVILAFVADLGMSYHGARQAIAEKETRLENVAHTANGARRSESVSRSVSADEIAAARETIQRLSMPWGDLFSALESTLTEDVALLAIEPDPKSGTVMISGDGKDYLATVNYVLELGRSKTLSHVHLVKHELRRNDSQQSVAFSVTASWKGAK